MYPIESRLLGNTNGGGSRCNPAAVAWLIPLCVGFSLPVATCPPNCICASDIISCSGHKLSALPFGLPNYASRLDLSHNAITVLPVGWVSQPFHRLATLILSQNYIGEIEVDAFAKMPHLLHLDLSSNQLMVLNSSIFHGLKELKELLLFGNQISRINPGTFTDLYSLQKVYLSGNRLTAFPLHLYKEPGGPLNLTFLDVSFNRLSKVPVQNLLFLTRRSGIYLQGNPLVCDCALLAMLEYWLWKQYRPLLEFRSEYPCKEGGEPESNCTVYQQGVSGNSLVTHTYQVNPGEWLSVPCPGLESPTQGELVVFWITPREVVNSSANGTSSHIQVLPNGTLEIQKALVEDSGTYWCVAARNWNYDPKKSPEVRVIVGNFTPASVSGLAYGSGGEHFNTAFTTLASCVASIVLVLLYLYLTPCRCWESRGGASRGCGERAIALCSDPREVEPAQRRSKRVAFLEPQVDDLNISNQKTPMINLGHVTTEGILKNGCRTVGQNFTDPAHMG
ncbi:amphoterin-induced protein 1-like [Thalassophryne amazonica]|uniref:amphoterin-induced protein 1-like n=1 Tax=Thalassophryne amazonica TaxID=390379 RepID=UPI0014718377|nr:amphoterin-induced protein 1-like [Thalassophryne amazonica]